MSKKCPACSEEINFDTRSIKYKTKKCPHCHELIHPQGFLEKEERRFVKLTKNVMKKVFSEKLWRLLFAIVFALFIAIIIGLAPVVTRMESWSPSWIIAGVAFVIVLLARTRPWNIQPTVLIAFITLLFVGLGNLWQKENFDLRNRPYIGMVPIYFDMTQETNNLKDKIFTFKLKIENSGEVGTILEDFEYMPFVSPNGKFLDVGEKIKGINLKKANEHYGVIEWRNAPVLPHSSIVQEITNNPFGITDFQLLDGKNSDVYFWLKAAYRPIGEKKRFHFWTLIKAKSNSEFQFVKSGEDDRDFAREYNIR